MIGKSILQYNILEKLGDGGMGEVYLAEDTKLKRKVALKFLSKKYSRVPEEKKRFMDEARSSSSLDHAYICTIYDVNETEDGQLFISMNYCKGENLQKYLKDNDLSIKRIVKYIIQIAKGLDNAHKKGIIHCDIKPSNIIITNDKVAKIVDFGIAKIASEEKLLKKDKISGTIAYMSPEQVSNDNIDARSDIWSLGVIFYEMLSKKAPFIDNYYDALMYAIVNEEPETISSINPKVSPELEQILVKMLKKKPEERYTSIKDLLADIKNYNRIIEIPLNPLKYFKIFISDKRNKKISMVFSFLISIFIVSTIYITVIRGTSVPSIGILNMENLGDTKDDFWSRGITEDLIVNVASAGVIRVPTINEVNKYNSLDISNVDLAEKLRVDYLLSSSFYKKDSTFDLWCRIIDPKTGKDIFAKKWTKLVKNASTITTLLAGSILNNLGISADKILTIPVIIDPDAYELYLKGKHTWETRQNNDDIFLSRGLLQRALDIDQNFMQAKIQLGQSYSGTADYNQALSIFQECLDFGKELNDERVIALATLNIGNIHLYKYQFEGATDNYKKALKIVRRHSDKYNEAKLLRNIGSSHYWQNNYKTAEEYYNESRVISVMLDDKLGEAESLFNLGSIFLETMQFKEAMISYKELYDIFDSINNKSQMGYSLNGISYSYMGMGDIDSALDYANASLESAREISDKQNELNSLTNLGEINFCIGNNDEAMNIFILSSELADKISDIYYSGYSNQYLGLLMLRLSNYQEALKYFERADNFWKKVKDPTHEVWTYASWSLAALRLGDRKTAADKLLQADSILKEIKPYKDFAATVYYNLYNYYITVGDTSIGKKYLTHANDEILKRLSYIDNQKIKNEFLNRIVEYGEISASYKKYFD